MAAIAFTEPPFSNESRRDVRESTLLNYFCPDNTVTSGILHMLAAGLSGKNVLLFLEAIPG